jgi:hypothetical protein
MQEREPFGLSFLVTPTVVHNIASQLYKKVFEKANA